MSVQVSIISYMYQVFIMAGRRITSEYTINMHSIMQDILLIMSTNTNCHM